MNNATKTTDEKKPVDEQKSNYSPIKEDERNARKLKIDAQRIIVSNSKSIFNDKKK
jgi:hypothetical protein